jgi:cytochrome c-type biogenesis protein CcmE
MKTKSKLVIALVVVVGILVVLVRTAITHASTYYVTVAELLQEGTSAVNQPTTVSGNIVGKSVLWDPTKSSLQFSMNDTPGMKGVTVMFNGPRPDDFDNDWPVIVTGAMATNGKFHATKLLIKCPSKYQTQPQTQTFTSTS